MRRIYIAAGLFVTVAAAFTWARWDAVRDARDADTLKDQSTAIGVQDAVSDAINNADPDADPDCLLNATGGLRDGEGDC